MAWQPQLEELMTRRWGRLVAYALLVAPTRGEAEDVVQEALVATFSGRARFGSLDEAEAYVRRAVVTRSIDVHRSRSAERRALERLAGRRQAWLVDAADVQVLDPELAAALATLAPRERACVVLRHVEDLSVAQTAAALRLSEGAVKRYVHDGVATLNAVLGTVAPNETQRVTTGGGRDA